MNTKTALDGALLINKHAGVSSFGIIEILQKDLRTRTGERRSNTKLGHGGTLDPFATGLLAVCAGRAVKLARYFLGATKSYEGTIRFGETTAPGDPTAPVIETSEKVPETITEIQEVATRLALHPYLQTPPMFSAKKMGGKPLYLLAREGTEVERESKVCHLREFEILSYEKPRAKFRLRCSSGTYVRTLAQDLGRLMGSVALLEDLNRTQSGSLTLAAAWSTDQIISSGKNWNELPCWVPFDRLLEGYSRAHATEDEAQALQNGRQNVLFNILKRMPPLNWNSTPEEDCIAIYQGDQLIAVARKGEQNVWGLERVFRS